MKEYGHLLGLHDEYSRSNDQVHQQLHLMGGKARKSHKALDAHTTRHMVTMALYPAIRAAMSSNIALAGAAIVVQGSWRVVGAPALLGPAGPS